MRPQEIFKHVFTNLDMNPLTFSIRAKDKKSRARAGTIKTAHGTIETPYLIPVATRGYIRCLDETDFKKLKVQALLANTYHLHFKPGDKEIKKAGGLHKYMKFNKPVFTDSGGFQAFSLGLGTQSSARKLGFFPKDRVSEENTEKVHATITEKGVIFTSVYDGSKTFMGPKESMEIQSNLGADIIMAFDECTSQQSSKAYIKEAMERSHRWELESLKYHNPKQALYGIIHGGWFKDLRLKSTRHIRDLTYNGTQFDGIAIGGSLGKTKADMYNILDILIPELDEARPRHMLGIGWIDDIFECVERGMDTFDCVEMTRIARHGNVYITPKVGGRKSNKFVHTIKESQPNKNQSIDPTCTCSTCKKYTRADLHKLRLEYKKGNTLYGYLATIHNIHFMHTLTQQIRDAIKEGTFQKLKKYWMKD